MKKVALINDLSGFGKCSLTAAIPVISVMGVQACPLPTAVLSAQTGFENYFYDDYTDKMNSITRHWKQMEEHFDGIYSGFLANTVQIENVLSFLEQFQEKDTLYLADPIMGDHGKAFGMFHEDFLLAMKKLTARADVITPNLTELCFLADVDYAELITHCQESDYFSRIKSICEKLLTKASREQIIIVTGILRRKAETEYIGNLAVSCREEFYIETPYTGISFSGTGDLYASTICGSLVKGLDIKTAMEKAACFLQTAIEDASRENIPRNHGVQFEKYLSRLI